jgi:prepilin-type N-terminal cleavage/methylation domain-containing protein
MQKKQSGFTLVEIAIVLVIIGLLLGGVIKGQELIVQAKIKNAIADFQGIATAVYGYQDRYKAFPGDDPRAHDRWASATSGAGDGQLKGTYKDAATTAIGTSETPYFWQDLRLAGFIAGDPTSTAQPLNAFGGVVGVQMSTNILGFTNPVLTVCSGSLPAKAAESIDAQLQGRFEQCWKQLLQQH